MNRTEFIVATAIILLLAFTLGWFTYWLMHRFTRVAGGDMGEMDLRKSFYLNLEDPTLK